MKQTALLTLSLLFGASFIGRAAVLAADAASATSAEPHAAEATEAEIKKQPTCLTGELAEAVAAAQEESGRRLAEAETRKRELAAIESNVAEHVEFLAAENARLEGLLAEIDGKADAKVQKLASIYQGMKPQQAGAIVAEMDTTFAAGLLAAMNSESAAQVLANMDSKRAYAISVLMAERVGG